CLLEFRFSLVYGFLFELGFLGLTMELDQKLKGLTLTEEEKEIVECEEEDSAVMGEQISLCLVGKLLSKNPYSVEALKNTMKATWRIEDNVIKAEITFETIRFWVKAYDVPLSKRTKSMAMSMASKMGTFIEYDDSDPLGWNRFMRFRVDLRLDKPLRRWIRVSVSGGSKWIELKYEKLMDFCYACGCIGHSLNGCQHYDDSTPEGELPYGSWMRASPTKKRRTFDPKKEEERKLCQAFKGSLLEGKARMKLKFDEVKGKEVGNSGGGRNSKRGRTEGEVGEEAAFDTPIDLPWCVVGDFNQILYNLEKKGGSNRAEREIREFREALDECYLQDLGYEGEASTWWNRQAVPNDVKERLDRGVATLSWIELFPNVVVQHLAFERFDHRPIKLTYVSRNNMWLLSPNCEKVINEAWSDVTEGDVLSKIQRCSEALSKWSREEYGSVNKKVTMVRGMIAELDSMEPTGDV
ncbi:hypothetical protein RDABS01_030951, partial [Bienertia sinuspersici]